MWSQLCGMNVMMYYTVYVMQSAGIGDPLTASSINYVLNVALTLPALLFLDKWGRRPTLLLGSFFMGSFLFLVGALEGVYGHPFHADSGKLASLTWMLEGNRAVSNTVVAFSYLAVCTFATSWGPVSWTYPSEIYPNQVRAKAVSLATASNWIWNCALAFAVPPLLKSINWKMYMIFGSFNYIAFIHMFLAAPETKGVPLEEMDEVFDSGHPPWKKFDHDSRLERMEKAIKQGNLKVTVPGENNNNNNPRATIIEIDSKEMRSGSATNPTFSSDEENM